MTLLEQIIKASTNPEISIEPIKYPVNLNINQIVSNLKPDSDNPNALPLLQTLSGLEIPESDSEFIDFSSKFFRKLKRKLNDSHSFSSQAFLDMLNSFLKNLGEKKLGGSFDVGTKGIDGVYTCELMEKVGSFVGKDVLGLVIEGCIVYENWDLLKTLIVHKLVDHGLCSNLVFNLVAKNRSDLICLCLQHFNDLNSSDLRSILKHFLSPLKEGLLSMNNVRKDWENEALHAIEKASDQKAKPKKLGLAKEAAMLLMVAYDGFSAFELCLHFLLSSSNLDEVVFTSAISKLNAEEILGLIRYLGKWVSKYEKFPQVGPCPKAITSLKLKMCQWVPRFEDVVKCLNLVVDQHFSSLVLHSEFHEVLKMIEGDVTSLVCEGRLSWSVMNSIEFLMPEVGDQA